MKHFIVIGKKWRDKINGNTYYNTLLIDEDTGKSYYSGFEYGYGNSWEYAGRKMIYDNKLLKRTNDFKITYIFAGYDTKSNLKNDIFNVWGFSSKD